MKAKTPAAACERIAGYAGSVGEFKQSLQKLNNRINQEIFDNGLKEQRVEVIGNRVLILALHRRVHVLQALDQAMPDMSRSMDVLLLQQFKQAFKKAFEQEFDIQIRTLLKDYDPETECSGTILILERPIDLTHGQNE